MQKLVRAALQQRALVLLLSVALLVWGGWSFTQLPIEAYPDVSNAEVQVITQWPGHAAEEVEKQITVPLETALNGVSGLESVRSRSLFGLSVVYLEFQDGVDDYFARQRVAERVNAADLPPNVQPGYSPLSSATGEIYRYALAGADLTTLRTVQDWIVTRELKSVPGIADVSTFGGLLKEYDVCLNPETLRAHDLTVKQVTDALQAANANTGGGLLERGSEEFVVRGLGLLSGAQAIENVTVASGDNGVPVRVRDVAKVRIGYRPRLGKVGWRLGDSLDKSRIDVDDAVLGVVLLRRGESPDTVLQGLHQKIAQLNQGTRLPHGVQIVTLVDRSSLVHTTTHTVEHNLIEGVILVVLVLVVFLGNLRAALIVALTIPISLLFAFALMNVRHVPANLLSLGAVDFGIIVNGTVILVEAIYHRLTARTDAESTLDCVLAAVGDVQTEIVVTTFIILIAYLPLFTLEGVAGKMFAPMAFTIGLALGGSLLMTLFLAPVLADLLLRSKLKPYNPVWLRWLTARYENGLSRALANPLPTLSVAAALVTFAVLLLPKLGTEFLPHLDEGNLWIRMQMPMTISQTEASVLVRRVRAVFAHYQPTRLVLSQNGRPDDGTDATGFYNAEYLVDLKPRDEWKGFHTKADLVSAMQKEVEQIPGVSFNFSQMIEDNVEEAATGVKGELAVKIFGDDLPTLEQTAEQVKTQITTVPGVVDVDTFEELGEPQVRIVADPARAGRLGITIQDVDDLVETAIGGKAVTQLLDGEQKFDVVARLDAPFRSDIGSIAQIPLSTPGGARVPLSDVAGVSVARGASFVYREGGRRFIAIKFGVRGRDLGGAVEEAQKKVAQSVHLPAGYETEWGGEFESMQKAQQRLLLVLPLTLGLIFFVLYLLFQSVSRAILAMLNVPLALVGGTVALSLAGMHLSIAAAVGFIALFGVAIQNGVILISHMDRLRARGMPLLQAVRTGAVDRLRAVAATASLASIGLLPAAFSTGIGSDTQKPLAVVIIGGIVSATLLTLFVLPVCYGLVVSAEARRKRRNLRASAVAASVALLLLLCPASGLCGPSRSASTFLSNGKSALQRHHWDQAEEQFRYAIGRSRNKGTSAQAYGLLSQVYLRTCRVERAREAAAYALSLDAEQKDALDTRKLLEADPHLDGYRADALDDATRRPHDADAHLRLASFFLHAEQWDKAREEAEATLKLKPRSAHALAIEGRVAEEQGNRDESLRLFEKALAIEPGDDHLLGSLGEVYLRRGDWAHAKELLGQAVHAAPDHAHWRDLLHQAEAGEGGKASAAPTSPSPADATTTP